MALFRDSFIEMNSVEVLGTPVKRSTGAISEAKPSADDFEVVVSFNLIRNKLSARYKGQPIGEAVTADCKTPLVERLVDLLEACKAEVPLTTMASMGAKRIAQRPKSTPAPLPPTFSPAGVAPPFSRPADDGVGTASLPNPATDRDSPFDPNEVEVTVGSQVMQDVADYFCSRSDQGKPEQASGSSGDKPEQATGSDINSQVARFFSNLNREYPEH